MMIIIKCGRTGGDILLSLSPTAPTLPPGNCGSSAGGGGRSVAGWTEPQRLWRRRRRRRLPAGETRPDQPGGRRIATWPGSCAAPSRSDFEKRSGLPGTGPRTLSAPLRPRRRPQRGERGEQTPAEPRQGERPGGGGSRRTGGRRGTFRGAPPLRARTTERDGNLSSSRNASVSGDGGVTAGLDDGGPVKRRLLEVEGNMAPGGGRLFLDFVGRPVTLSRLFIAKRGRCSAFYYRKLCAWLRSPRPTHLAEPTAVELAA